MNRRLLGAALLAAGISLGTIGAIIMTRPTHAAANESEVGRYRLEGYGGTVQNLWMIDTKTGKVWEWSRGTWAKRDSPVAGD